MTTKKQSLRLTKQQKEGHGVIGIFGENAKKHDFTVESVSFAVIKHLDSTFIPLQNPCQKGRNQYCLAEN